MTGRWLTTLAVVVAVAACSLPLASAATVPLGSPAPAASTGFPVLGFAAMLPDRAHSAVGRFLADGSRLTIAATDAAGTEWRVTLEAGALPYPLELHVTPLIRTAVWGSELRASGGILIEPAAELAVPAEVTAGGPGGAMQSPTLVADVDGRNLRLAAHAPSSPQTALVTRLGAVLAAHVPANVSAADHAAVLAAAATLSSLPIPPAVTPPDLAFGCDAGPEASARHSLSDALIAADVDPERTLVEQLAASDDAGDGSRATDGQTAAALVRRVAQRVAASIDAARTGAARGEARFDAAAMAAESIQSSLSLFPQSASPVPAATAPGASPTPGIEREQSDPMSVLVGAITAWAGDLAVADADALAADHDYDAPDRVAARERLVAQLGVHLPADDLSRLLASERYHLTLDAALASHSATGPPLAAHAHLEADLAPAQGVPGSASGSASGVELRLGALLPCATPPVALLGADSFGAGVVAGTGDLSRGDVDAAVRSAFERQLAGGGLLSFPLVDGASPAVDATITGTGTIPRHAEAIDVSIHALLTHTPAPSG